jgi:hypothetical protein
MARALALPDWSSSPFQALRAAMNFGFLWTQRMIVRRIPVLLLVGQLASQQARNNELYEQ